MLVWEPGERERGDGKVVMEEGEEIIPREEAVQAGDLIGFQTGIQRAHVMKAGEREKGLSSQRAEDGHQLGGWRG